MGMYTELMINARVNNDMNVINILKKMAGDDTVSVTLPDHPLFKTDRWQFMLRCSSYYFTPVTTNVLSYDDIGDYWCFINVSSFKNYDNEVSKFFDWIKPHLESENEMIGYHRYEEDREPTIVYS